MMKKVQRILRYLFEKGLISLLILLMISITGFSQNVGMSPTGATQPNAAAGLDVNFATKGLLIPRVALQDTLLAAPLSAHVSGMLVYNTTTSATLSPGIYYDNGTKWVSGFPKANAAGDIQYWDGNKWVNIPAGTVGQSLQIDGSGIPAWSGVSVPVLTTKPVTAILATTASSGGLILNDGGSPITDYGVCWSLIPSPTIADNFISSGSGIGSFSSNVTGLTTATTYYIRAYATTSTSTTYGNELNFVTP